MKYLTLETLRAQHPAIFAEEPAAGVSSSYSFIPTVRVIEPLLDHGWMVTRANSQMNRKRQPLPHGAHFVALHHRDLPAIRGEGHVEVILFNSHNRTRRIALRTGIFRLVCENGLVVPAGMCASVTMTHLLNVVQLGSILPAIDAIQASAPRVSEFIRDFKQVETSGPERTWFAHKALESRYGTCTPTISTEAVLTTRRKADEPNNLWVVMNRVQENLMRGVADGRHESRPIGSLQEQMRINQDLWSFASELVKMRN